VALSTNSVAASVEPVMQQQFFTLSPMPGQESFSAIDVRPQHMIAHTPTTSSMLAALQQDPFPTPSLDPTSSAFNSDAYGSLSYMDTSASQDDSGHSSGLSFPDFPGAGNAFDVGGFPPPELGMNSGASSNESDHDPEPVKTEQQSGS
jgi:regulatory factor X, other